MKTETDHHRPSIGVFLLRQVLPAFLLLLVGGAFIYGIVVLFRSEPPKKEVTRVLPVVETIPLQSQTVSLEVAAQGTVEPRIRTDLLAEVSGRIESISPALYAGGFFDEGDVLATIEPIDYEANLAMAMSRYADAVLALEQEKAAAAQALEDWKAVGNGKVPSELVLRQPQLARAKANLEASAAAVRKAERDLQRTEIRAPYRGRVQQKFVDLGQIASARVTPIARIYSIDTAEIRLAINLDETRYIDLPETASHNPSPASKPKVVIKTEYGGTVYQWEGVIDRSEGAVDPQTRLLYLVAQVDDPYNLNGQPSQPPLKIGSFVTAAIQGKQLQNAFAIPRRALRANDTVFIVTPKGSLDVREVEVYQKTTEVAIITAGVANGEQLCMTPLQYVVDGMDVAVENSHEQEVAADARRSEGDSNL